MTDSSQDRNRNRRALLRGTAAAAAAAGVAACTKKAEAPAEGAPAKAPAVHRQTFEWKIVTTWPPNLPIFAEGVQLFADQIAAMSDGRLKIRVFHGGELVPPLETFEAVRQGTADMGHGAAYYWAGKVPAAQFFTSAPFGMNTQQMYGWLHTGGGAELWQEVYADFNLVPMACGSTGMQMGGWFNREINSVADLRGLKMRMPGLGGKVLALAGASAELLPGGELYTSLERGVIDATEWVGPYHDYVMGFHKVAKYYYGPGWHEPAGIMELIVNRQAFEKLPADLQEIVRRAAAAQNLWMLAQFEGQNAVYLRKLLDEEKVNLKRFPDDVLDALRGYARQAVEELAAGDAMAAKVVESFRTFQQRAAAWADISEGAYFTAMR